MLCLRRSVALCAMLVAATAVAEKGERRYWPGPVLTAEAQSQELCESEPDRLFVSTKHGSECIAYVVTHGNEARREAVFFFNGDSPPFPDKAAFDDHMRKGEATALKRMQKWADKFHVRYVYVSRLGLQGSSGDHRERRKPHETYMMDAAVKQLQKLLAIDDFAIVGQSGGSTISAGLLTLGLSGVKCAVLGSGAYELVDLEYELKTKKHHQNVVKTALARRMYDPSKHIANIEQDTERRIFVIGDPQDQKAYFPQQKHFAEALSAAGHHTDLIEVAAYEHHGAAKYTIPAAGACLNGLSDEKIEHAIERMQPHREKHEEDAGAGDTTE
jgi:pimeloyl-ACP methyl ester carboxylesterase